jgi:hypothetical protein
VDGARNHSIQINGVLRGQYTNTPVIGSGAEFEKILERQSANDAFVISTAQVSEALKRRNRAGGIAEVLASERLEAIYKGRDDETTVWRQRRGRTPVK